MGEQPSTHTPVTYDRCAHIEGPFYHGTRSALEAGAELVPGYGSNFHQGRVSNNIYFAALVETAAWGAELATALTESAERGHIYVVEPTGPFEDDPNVTNKRFLGNPTQSCRTRHPLRVVAELESWQGHPPEVLKGMLDHVAQLREHGLDVIEDWRGHELAERGHAYPCRPESKLGTLSQARGPAEPPGACADIGYGRR